jgi:serine/threonine-protein kinase RsbW
MVIRIEFSSTLEMLDLVQSASDQILRPLCLDDDIEQQVNTTIRESVINAIRHGNRNDTNKRVFVEFSTENSADGCDLTIRVRDEGEGFDLASVPDPCAEENLLKTSGRGILMIRTYMDDVELDTVSGGGTEIRMHKHIPVVPSSGKIPL